MNAPDGKIAELEGRLRTLEAVQNHSCNPFEDPVIQIALEDGGTVSARTRYVYLQPDDFVLGLGAPTLGTHGAWAVGTRCWTFRAGAADGIMGSKALLPSDWASGTVEATAFYQGAGADVGNRVLGIGMSALAVGADSILKAVDATEEKAVVHGNTVLNIATFSVGVLTVADGALLRVTFWRDGASGADPNGDSMYFFGIVLKYTAFF